ncbi:MAG: hypothetical protein ACKVXR_08425 [Planctomycetota bacterium]
MKHPLAIACALSLTLAAPALAIGKSPSTKQLGQPGTLDPKLAGLLPGMHGEGSGTWRAATKTPGRLRATSTVDPEGTTFGFDAVLTRVAIKGSTEISGELLGEMILVDPKAGSHTVALIAGVWSQEADGRGAFAAHILMPTGDRDEPFLAVGRCVGPFEVPPPELRGRSKGTVTFRWSVSR